MMAKGKAHIYLGRIVKPFGIKGEVKLLPSDDFWEMVLESKELILAVITGDERKETPMALSRSRKHGGVYILKLEGVDDRTNAESMVGTELLLPADKIDVDLPEEILPFQVAGCSVITDDGVKLGIVTALLFTPAHNIYEVTGEKGVNLIPAVPEFILRQDFEKGEIVIKPIPGLLND